jgi:hypothetical protein
MFSHTNDDGQIMIPDLVFYSDMLSCIRFELFVAEVKKEGNYSNGHIEKDLIKLRKEMQLALNMMVYYKVKDPEVVGLLVEGMITLLIVCLASTKLFEIGLIMLFYKMDLCYNGQYRMIKIITCNMIRKNANDDILLVLSNIQKLDQVTVSSND